MSHSSTWLTNLQAGEDLDEDEDEEKGEDEEQLAGSSQEVTEPTEHTPLLRGRFNSALLVPDRFQGSVKGSAGPHHGSATVTQAVLMVSPPGSWEKTCCHFTTCFSFLNLLLELVCCS